MTTDPAFRQAERAVEAVDQLATFAAALRYPQLPSSARSRLRTMLTDLWGVTLAGVRTPEGRALVTAWQSPAGDSPVPGTGIRTTADTASYLSAVAACLLELDEGNKHAAGHPAAHVVFAAVAAARSSEEPVSGARFLSAVAAGYEVAARFGRATSRDPRWHTHGHWGATGAACAAALVHGGNAEQVAAAIDAATGLMHVAPWQTVLAGDFTRNLWIAGANRAGLDAARLARAGLVRNQGSAAHALAIVGSLDPEVLVRDLGQEWLLSEGYLKQHSACSYTHGAVDLVQTLRAAGAWRRPDDVAAVRVAVHSLAAPLLRRNPTNRLSAMFSLPFVVATAVVSDRVDPTSMTPGTAAFASAEDFSDRVSVRVDERLDRHLPARRVTEVEVELRDGTRMALAQPNPIGDTDHHPLGEADVHAKLDRLVGSADARRVVDVVADLEGCASVVPVLAGLP